VVAMGDLEAIPKPDGRGCYSYNEAKEYLKKMKIAVRYSRRGERTRREAATQRQVQNR
jgi:hypothetical protein